MDSSFTLASVVPTYISERMSGLFNTKIKADGWMICIIFLLFIIFVLWLFFGGGTYEFVGLAPMKVGVDSTKYANAHTMHVVTRDHPILPSVTDSSQSGGGTERVPKVSEPDCSLGCHKAYKNSRISKGEKACKVALEEIYGVPFHCVRPDFLKNPETNRNLELDLYNDQLKIAVELNGIQHYKWPNYTGQTKEEFIKQLRRDKFKVDKCDENGIYLITVPYTVPLDKIKEYIVYYLPENYEKRISGNSNTSDKYDPITSSEDFSDNDPDDDNDSSDTDYLLKTSESED